MHDTINCEYLLPLPEELGECKELEWDEIEFQTKSFQNTPDLQLGSYTISDDGQIYLNKELGEWVEDSALPLGGYIDKKPDGIEKLDFTGEVYFYTVHLGEDKDYWMEFKAIFYKGDLKEMLLEEWKSESSKERKKATDKFQSMITELQNREKKWWFVFYKSYLLLVRGFFFMARWTIATIAKFTLWVENKIT